MEINVSDLIRVRHSENGGWMQIFWHGDRNLTGEEACRLEWPLLERGKDLFLLNLMFSCLFFGNDGLFSECDNV